MIVLLQPFRAAPLLARQRQRRMPGYLGFINPMKLFMRTILTRPARRDELHLNSQFDPPGAQPGQSRWSTTAKRGAIVTANPLGQPVFPEDFQELLAGFLQSLAAQQAHPQTIATMQIPHCQRIYPCAVTRSIRALEIHRPDANPQCLSQRLIAATEGKPIPPKSLCRRCRSLRAPQLGCLSRRRRTRSSQSSPVLPGTLRGRRD